MAAPANDAVTTRVSRGIASNLAGTGCRACFNRFLEQHMDADPNRTPRRWDHRRGYAFDNLTGKI